MNFGTWNVQSLSQKVNDVVHELKQFNVDIAALTETKKKRSNSENLGFYDHCYSRMLKYKKQGVSIFMPQKFEKMYISLGTD